MDTSKSFPSGGIRVSDADRDQAIAELSEHFQAGGSRRRSSRTGPGARCRPGPGTTSPPCSPTCRAGHGAVPAAGGPVFGAGGTGDLNRMSHLPMARLIIFGVLAVIIVGNVLGGIAGHIGFGWLIPVVVLGSVFVRLARR